MIITQTPLRVSLVGGGTDLPDCYRLNGGGRVISAAIDKYIYVIIKRRFDEKIRIGYMRTELVDGLEEVQHDLVREALRKTGIAQGVEIATMADIPSEGSGLGSSSSVTVGLLNAMYAYRGEVQTAERLAREACEIEIDTLGKPIGKQDQYIAAYGNLREFRFEPDDSVLVKEVKIAEETKRELERNLMLFYTGMTRSADQILREQRSNIPRTMEALSGILALVEEVSACLQQGDLDTFGRLLHRSWDYKRQLAGGITNPEIDALYDRALRAGALGGKVAGAGGGGFLVLYCPQARQRAVRETLRGLRELPFRFGDDGSKVIFNVRG